MMRTMIAMALLGAFLVGCATHGREEFELAETHRRLADMKLSKGEVAYAIREYRAAIELYPGDAESHFGLGVAYLAKGLSSEARDSFKRALRIEPRHNEARLNLGLTYIQEEDWKRAIEVFGGLSDDPAFLRPERALVNLGWALYKSGDLEASKQKLLLALGENRTNYVAHLDLGIVYYDQGELVDALASYTAAEQILDTAAPVEPFLSARSEVLFRMAQTHVKLGQHERAVAQLLRAAEVGGDGEWARKSREYLEVLR